MWRVVLGVLAAIGVLSLLAVVGIGAAVWRLAAVGAPRPSLPNTIVLQADLTSGLAEGAGQDALSELAFGRTPTLRDFIDALDRGGDDARVKGVYLQLGSSDSDNMALARCQEVRDAIAAFRAKGKFAIAFATSFSEFGPGTRPYYLATAADEIWLQPQGSVGLIGLAVETPFLRGTLDRLGIAPSFAHREQYKTAANALTETAMTAAQREETEDLLGDDERQIVAGIAAARKLPQPQVATLIDRGPFLAAEAKQAGLVDRIGYGDEARARAVARAGTGARFVSLKNYLDAAGRPHASGAAKIALIYGEGLIVGGDGGGGGGGNSALADDELSAQRMARAFGDAVRDPAVKAILFRIDSPGGSAVASETIWREVARAKAQGRPVIVSMGDVAGSGGYYIAAPADKIVAEPATLTGSIGVLAGKLVVAGLLDKIGASETLVQRGANAAMFSAVADFSPRAQQRLDAFLDATYAGFKQHVAVGRHLTADQVEAVAKGRVWTGAEAKQNGLVDALGGYETALRLAAAAAKLPAGQPFRVAVFPRARSALERLYDRLEGDRDDSSGGGLGAGGAASSFARAAADVVQLIDRVESLADRHILQMPPLGDIR
jgi:protease IV